MFEYSGGGDLFLAASQGETRLVFDGFVDEDGEAGETVIVLAWSTEDLVESHFVKATDAFDRSMHKFRILVLVNCPRTTNGRAANRFFA